MIDLKIVKFVKKNYISLSGFQIIFKFVGIDQIICKNGNKSSSTRGHQILFPRNRLKQSRPHMFLQTILSGMKLL